MKLAIDVGYHDSGATSAGVLFQDWADNQPTEESSIQVKDVRPYEPGKFYRRELPCIAALLDSITCDLDTVVIDGFVWLSPDLENGTPGLGAYLFEHLDQRVPVIGVAKTEFVGAKAEQLFRGGSKRPLFISAAGIELPDAVRAIESMHGEHRLPTLLKRVDELSRIKPA